MGWITGIGLYVIIWWTVLFAVLPWGVRPPDQPEPGTAPSAPARPRLLLKFGVTSLLAGLIWLALYALVRFDVISFRAIVQPG